MKYTFLLLLTALLLLPGMAAAQDGPEDKGEFREWKNEFWENIRDVSDEFYEEEEEPRMLFKLDYSGMELPESTDEFTTFWHTEPMSQGRTGTCWTFSTTSFFESELNRLYGVEVKLSPVWTAYWEYVEKARRFIRERGDSYLGEGSEADAVIRIYKQYGVVPESAYNGLIEGREFHDHEALFDELKAYLHSIKENTAWNEEENLMTVKAILNYHLGEPPAEVTIEGQTMSPKEYLNDYLKLPLNDYVGIISLMKDPYYEMVVYTVPDNWWFSDDYHNVPLDDFMTILKGAVRDGYSVCIGGDVSEPGIDSYAEVAVVPDFDIPADYINEYSRQMRFSNETTTDDHGVHIVGWKNDGGKDWYLIKDSGSGSFNGPNKGYYFFHEDYVKLKIIDYMVHKDAVPEEILSKFKK